MRRALFSLLLILAALVAWRLALRFTHDAPRHARDSAASDGDSSIRFAATEPGFFEAAEAGAGGRESVPAAVSQPAGTLAIRGRVMNLAYPGLSDSAQPAAGAKLRVELDQGMFDTTPAFAMVELETDGDGRFAIDPPDPRRRPLQVMARSETDGLYRPLRIDASIPPGSFAVELLLERQAHGGQVGRIESPAGEPLADLRIRLDRDGRVPLEAVSDAEGRFAIENCDGWGEPLLDAPGWRMLDATAREVRTEGGWKDLRIVAVGTGRLRLRARDAQARPLAGARVRVGLPASEHQLRPYQGFAGDRPAELSGQTDEHGEVSIEGAWAGCPLWIALSRNNIDHWARARIAERLVLGPAAGECQPILVEPGGELGLEIVLDDAFHVRGQVRSRAGEPVPRAALRPALEGQPWKQMSWIPYGTSADAQGRFDLELAWPPAGSTYELHIVSPETNEWGDWRPVQGLRATIDPAEAVGAAEVIGATGATGATGAAGGLIERDFVLEPYLTISGTVRGPTGTPLEASVCALRSRAGPEQPFDDRAQDVTWSGSRSDGRFELRGLYAGSHDLYVRLKPTQWHRLRSFPRIEAGRLNLDLVVADEPEVHVSLRARPREGELRSLIVLDTRAPAHPGVEPLAPGRHELSDRALVPRWLTLNFVGASGSADVSEGYTTGVVHGTDVYECPARENGWYVFALQGFDAQGWPYYPAGSGGVCLAAGEYELVFDLIPTGHLEGIVRGAPESELCVALLDERGRHLAVPGENGRSRDRVALGAEGRFHIRHAPAGNWRLAAGTEEELAAGRWRHAWEIEVPARASARVELELP